MEEINKVYFDENEIENGDHIKLINFLMSQSYSSKDLLNDIHIYPADLGAFVVEWVQVPWSHEYGGSFKYVGEEQYVMNEVRLPDGSYEYTDIDPEEYLKMWLEDNPDYKDKEK